MEPFIPIANASCNLAQFCQQPIDSIANQTFRAAEHIVIDGVSTDGTADIIKGNVDKLAYWFSELGIEVCKS